MLESIKDILIRRDGNTPEEAEDRIAEAKEALNQYLDEGDTGSAYDICEEFFGLEPDYIYELID